MKRPHTLLLLLMMTVAISSRIDAHSGPVTYERARVSGASVHLVTVDLRSREIAITPVMATEGAKGRRHPSQSFSRFIRQHTPLCAINGTHFDTVTQTPVSTIIIDGKTRSRGGVGSAICFAEGNRIEFLPLAKMMRKKFRHVICAGPTLLRGGAVWLNPRLERYRDPRIYGSARRSAIGLTRQNKLLLFTSNGSISLRTLARVMRTLGCTDAVAMDGGSSSALYYRGRYLTLPARRLTNILAVSTRAASASLADLRK